jgi:hypothetical protein
MSDKHVEALVRSQDRVGEALEAMAAEGGAHVDAESRMRLRSIDVQMLRWLEEMAAGRTESVAAIRTEIATLTQTIRDLSVEPEQ